MLISKNFSAHAYKKLDNLITERTNDLHHIAFSYLHAARRGSVCEKKERSYRLSLEKMIGIFAASTVAILAGIVLFVIEHILRAIRTNSR